MSLRIDKFLWCVRLTKTRSIATELVSKKKVRCNAAEVKASKEIKVGDHLTIQKANAWFSYRVVGLTEKRVGAPLVDQFIIDITHESERQKLLDYNAAQRAYQQFGTGKPSKKNRRHLDKFFTADAEDQAQG
jgi:ribosome-associated heat shock protein Hsp15